MTKLQVVEFLLNEVKKEQEYIERYANEESQAKLSFENEKLLGLTGKWVSWYDSKYFSLYDDRSPNRQLIKDNLKMIRRLTLEISKEI